MFLKIGNDYFNTAQIKRIRPYTKKDDPEQYAVVELLDGQMVDGRCLESCVNRLTCQYFPAPPGIEISKWACDSAFKPVAELRKEAVVGFALDGFEEFYPVTVESGVVDSSHNLTFKDGCVRASWGEQFGSEAEMVEAARKRFANEAT